MYVKLTVSERLKDLRTERRLTLEQLAEQTGISKAALGKYEADDFKDISPFSMAALAKFYGVSTDYLMGLTEQKNHPNTELDALHLSDGALEVLKSGTINNRLLSELICHKGFRRLMVDMEIYVDRIASMQIDNLNTYMDTVRRAVWERFQPDENELYFRTLEASHIQEDEYFSDTLRGDLLDILRDIRDGHKKDTLTAPEGRAADDFQKKVAEVVAAKGSEEEKQARIFCHSLGINYDKLTAEEFVSLIQILEKSQSLKSPYSKRGKANHANRGKNKRR